MFFSSPPIFPAKPWCVAWNFRRGVRFDKGKRDAYRSKDDFSSGLNPLGGPYLPTQAFSEKKQKKSDFFLRPLSQKMRYRCLCQVPSPPRCVFAPPPKKKYRTFGEQYGACGCSKKSLSYQRYDLKNSKIAEESVARNPLLRISEFFAFLQR